MARPLSGRSLEALPPLGREFYQRPTRAVARDLLGKLLVRALPEGVVAARLVEVEAYLGVSDPAAHTFGGRRTARNEVMWGDGGHLYVYFVYGMHFCMNVVTRTAGVPQAVLLRAALPVRGEEIVGARRAGRAGPHVFDGPARLCQGLGVDRELNGADLTTGTAIWLASDGVVCGRSWVRRLPRVGVAYAREAAAWPLRFALDLRAPVSRAPACGAPRGGATPRAGA
jgi:DNA-3-methyladenine glycosylase